MSSVPSLGATVVNRVQIKSGNDWYVKKFLEMYRVLEK